MTWTKLLANKDAKKHRTSKKELDNMRALIARDLADASLVGLSADRRFATAYAPSASSRDFRRARPELQPLRFPFRDRTTLFCRNALDFTAAI
ncbi:MAG TPA: hypothetical protein VN948_08960 [Terriglobales bacterium]|nr:hypothetical protein [Terriglobales bacterium]